MAQLSAAISVLYPTGSAVGFIALYIVSIAASRYFRNLTSFVAHIGEKEEDSLVRFKMLDDLAKSKPMQHLTLQTEKAKIINDHPEISTLNYFASFDEMIRFAKTYEVSKLNLSAISLNEDQIDILTSQLPNLTHLNIHNCRLIKDFIISSIDDLNLKKITSRLTKLTDLDVGKNIALTSDALKTIASLKDLTHLDISCPKMDSSTFQLLATHLKKLTHLNISYCKNIKSSDIQTLTNLTNLIYLDVSGCDVDDTSLEAISTHLKNLTYLNINQCDKITASGIATIISLTNLTHLIMWDCKEVNDISLQAIATHLSKLTYLDLSDCSEITSAGIQSLSALSNLSWLSLSNCKVNDISLQTIATHLHKLTYLDLYHCSEITSVGIQSLRTLSNLSWLDLCDCDGVNDTSLQTIATHLKKLTRLDLSRCSRITSVGIQSLRTLSNLSWLNLFNFPGVDDPSLQIIAQHLKKLIYLDIQSYRNVASHAGLKHFTSFKKIEILHSIR